MPRTKVQLKNAVDACGAVGTSRAKLIDLFPGLDDKDATIPKPKDVVFSFGTAGFRAKVKSVKYAQKYVHQLDIH